MEKLPEIKNAKQVGKNLNVIIGEEKFTVTGTKEELTPIKEAIKAFQEKPTKAKMTALKKLLTPASTAKAEETEKEVVAVKAAIKKEKKVVKETPKVKPAKVSKSKRSLVDDLKAAVGSGELTDEEKVEMRKLLADAKDIATPKPITTPVERRSRREF